MLTLHIRTATGEIILPMTTVETRICAPDARWIVTPTLDDDESLQFAEFVGDEFALQTIEYLYAEGSITADESRALDGTFEFAWSMLLDGQPVDHATLQATLNPNMEF
jgi:hypothetical protein